MLEAVAFYCRIPSLYTRRIRVAQWFHDKLIEKIERVSVSPVGAGVAII